MIRLNNDWIFTTRWSDAFLSGEEGGEIVRIPHTVQQLPLHYADHKAYQMICGYRKTLPITTQMQGKKVFLQFDAAAHIATVFVNGKDLATHRSGYTAFRVDITDAITFDGENTVAVRLDTTENPEVPPFGFVIDYLTYGGIYRDVWLDVREQNYLSDLFVYTPECNTAIISCNASLGGRIRYEILDEDKVLASCEAFSGENVTVTVSNVTAWELYKPKLYTCRATSVESGDTLETAFGFRTAVFCADGFYLNGKKVFLRGLNRHQCIPYAGYAVPEKLQREDARILKQELQCNAVRTSHYPQSQYFIDECDRLGLLVFTEIPGWQHVGDEKWQEQACENVQEMVLQYRNHPSIILWGVRVNESQDFHDFYTRTNAIAHKLDPSRATSGVRYLEKSELLEDVYAFNDFSHTGENKGAKPRKAVSKDPNKALLISECNGHMYPTKSFDTWQRRQEHALRHARVHDAAIADGDHAGCFGWCMFDYATHKDFGSGDRICYHGVMDSFRNPKLAASFYASQGDGEAVIEVGSSMDIGDYPAGNIGTTFVFTNAEEVELYKNDDFVTSMKPQNWKGLRHGPIPVEDTIGVLLETKEHFPKAKAEMLRSCLISAGKFGLSAMPVKDMLRMLYCMLRYKMSFQDGVDLFGKYVGNWGGESTRWRFDAKISGKVVASVTKSPSDRLHLEVKTSHRDLREGDVYDMAAVRVRILDENGNVAPYAQIPVHFKLDGPAHLIGPDTVTAEGGMCGTYICTDGKQGELTLTVSTPQTECVFVDFTVR